MRNECDRCDHLAIFLFLCVLYSFTSLVMVAILIPCLPANSDNFISIADTRPWNQRHNCWTGEGCYGRWKILLFRIRLSSKLETGYSVNCAKSVHDGWMMMMTFEIKARNKRSKGSCICWTCGQIRYLVISINNQHLSSDQCDIDSPAQGDGVKSAGHWTWVEQWTNYPCRCQRLVRTLSIL